MSRNLANTIPGVREFLIIGKDGTVNSEGASVKIHGKSFWVMGIESFKKSDGQRVREGGMKEAPMHTYYKLWEGRTRAPGSDE